MAYACSANLPVVDLLVGNYFNLVYKKYGVSFPEDASWKEATALNDDTRIVHKTTNMLFEIADLFEATRVEELVKKCEKLCPRHCLNDVNVYSPFTRTIAILLDDGLSWGKIVVFFSFSASFAIYLSNNGMNHLADRVCVWAGQILRSRLQPWVDEKGGWVSRACVLLCCLRGTSVFEQIFEGSKLNYGVL